MTMTTLISLGSSAETWPASNLLIAATNHAELLDPAVERRFELVIPFPDPSRQDLETLGRGILTTHHNSPKKRFLLGRGEKLAEKIDYRGGFCDSPAPAFVWGHQP